MAEHLLKNAHHLQEYAIETETVPELDSLPDQPANQVNYIITRGLSPLSDKHLSKLLPKYWHRIPFNSILVSVLLIAILNTRTSVKAFNVDQCKRTRNLV